MERMSWKDGWHIDGLLQYYIENGVFVRGLTYDGRPKYPYIEARQGGYDRVYNMKANKRNYEKLVWL